MTPRQRGMVRVSSRANAPAGAAHRSRPRLRSPWGRWGAIAAGGAPIVIAGVVGRGGLPLPLPPCLFQRVVGFPFPSCGLTRSFLALARGDWATALTYHLFGPVLVAALVALVAIATVELLTQRSHQRLYQAILHPRLMLPFTLLFLAYYGLRLWVRIAPPVLPWQLADTALWQHLVAGAIAL